MAEIKEAMPAPQPEALDMPDDEVLYELCLLYTSNRSHGFCKGVSPLLLAERQFFL